METTVSEQAEALSSTRRDIRAAPKKYDPLGTCPPPLRRRYANHALKASRGSLVSMIRLKCLECCAWNSAEVRRCEIRGCALWLRARGVRKVDDLETEGESPISGGGDEVR